MAVTCCARRSDLARIAALFGEDGFGWIDGQGVRKPNAASCQSTPILDAVASSNELYALTNDSLETYSTRLCKRFRWLQEPDASGWKAGSCRA